MAYCYWECARPTYTPGRTDSKARRKANTPSLSRFATFWFGVYLAAWFLLIFLLMLDGVVKVDEAAFNPFEILGVEVRPRTACAVLPPPPPRPQSASAPAPPRARAPLSALLNSHGSPSPTGACER